ncbi:ABC transporter substrate-binding protein [Halomonas salipaludis]|uniref:ABC transporter substrate-binding protein n=1 Tax=Halomonas salipaludis TaxID=2032625 RepID=A0A2A2F0L5_9GAMM|nr:ABC transporter substrate-binding protein [Halomonas salipaludis]PAU78132.1 ABC transporter substrate-binding protein [Halomonas salipaludis]
MVISLPRSHHSLTASLAMIALLGSATSLAGAPPGDWQAVVEEARGQSVYWHAWGGDSRTNRYLEWVAERMQAEYDVDVIHVKLGDTSEAVSRVLAEKQAGNDDEGSVDLVWINGENFAAMRANDLLFGPFTEQLPHFALTHPEHNPEVVTDFTLPTDGFESPWGKAQITFYYDSQEIDTPPMSIVELKAWAEANPGRFSYPRIPDFTGSTFLKQALIELSDADQALYAPVEESDFDAISAPLWDYLDALHPHLWRSGRQFPASGPDMLRLVGDAELSLAFTFNPAEPAAAVADAALPPSTRSYVFEGGTLGNVHFVAIPYNSPHKAAAMLLADFLLTPEAQARKQDLAVWGDPTVLDVTRLDDEQAARFEGVEDNPALLAPDALERTLPEPHPSWMEALQDAWQARYVGR